MKIIIKFLALSIILLNILGCSNNSKESTKFNIAKPFENQSITIIVPNIGDRLIRGPIMQEAKKFEKETGATIRVVTPGWVDTIEKTKESLIDPKINFDIFVIMTSWGGSLLGENDIESAASQIIKGYTEAFALEDGELDVLFGLAAMRLVQSIIMTSNAAKDAPDNDYIVISQKPARALLKRLEER